MPHSEPETRAWTDIAQEKRIARDRAISPFYPLKALEFYVEDSIATVVEKPNTQQATKHLLADLTDMTSLERLHELLLNRQITAKQLTLAYIHKAAAAQQETNCITEPLFASAITQAQSVDDHLIAHGTLLGPFHGIPMSLKDQFDVKGFDSTMGYVGRAFKPAEKDSVIVEMLRNMGAIFVAKTNLPQSIMWCETENPLFGQTSHPSDPSLTPGGSSGGEGALLAMQGALIGWGTDIGGSIRIPSHMCGLYGLKPSSGRLPYHDTPVTTSGQEHVPSVLGPMARSLSLLTTSTKAILSQSPWRHDPKCVPLPWNDQTYLAAQTRPLVVGILPDDGIVRPHPPIRRAVEQTEQLLRAAGHHVVPWDADDHAECVALMDEYYVADSCDDVLADLAVAGEPPIPAVETLINRAKAQRHDGEKISVFEYWALNRRKVALQKKMLEKWERALCCEDGKERRVDVVVMPTMPHVAVEHGMCRWVGYTKVWNLMDYAACAVPAGVVGDEEDGEMEGWMDHEPRNEVDAHIGMLYDPNRMKGLPLSVQIVGRRLDEERVLGAAGVVDELLRADERSRDV